MTPHQRYVQGSPRPAICDIENLDRLMYVHTWSFRGRKEFSEFLFDHQDQYQRRFHYEHLPQPSLWWFEGAGYHHLYEDHESMIWTKRSSSTWSTRLHTSHWDVFYRSCCAVGSLLRSWLSVASLHHHAKSMIDFLDFTVRITLKFRRWIKYNLGQWTILVDADVVVANFLWCLNSKKNHFYFCTW